jgi:hypothetical protein
MFGFNAAPSDEPIKGTPKFIRTVTKELMQESEFDPQGKLVERRGSLSHRETQSDPSLTGEMANVLN